MFFQTRFPHPHHSGGFGVVASLLQSLMKGKNSPMEHHQSTIVYKLVTEPPTIIRFFKVFQQSAFLFMNIVVIVTYLLTADNIAFYS